MHLSQFLFGIILVGSACGKFELPPLLEEELKRGWAVQALLLWQEDVRGKYEPVTFSGKHARATLSVCCHYYYLNFIVTVIVFYSQVRFVQLFGFCV